MDIPSPAGLRQSWVNDDGINCCGFCELTVPAEQLEGDVLLTGAAADAASLYIPFQHIYTSKHREN